MHASSVSMDLTLELFININFPKNIEWGEIFSKMKTVWNNSQSYFRGYRDAEMGDAARVGHEKIWLGEFHQCILSLCKYISRVVRAGADMGGTLTN